VLYSVILLAVDAVQCDAVGSRCCTV